MKGKKQVLDTFAEGQAPSEPDNESPLRFVHCMSSPGVHSELFLRAFEVCTPVLGIYWRIAMNDGYCLLV